MCNENNYYSLLASYLSTYSKDAKNPSILKTSRC